MKFKMTKEQQRLASIESNQRSRRLNPERIRRQKLAGNPRRVDAQKANRAHMIALLGGRCAACSQPDTRQLDFDHIAGDGHADQFATGRFMSGYPSALRELKRSGEVVLRARFQLLCKVCHQEKTLSDRKEQQQNQSQAEATNYMPLFDWTELACTRLDDIFSQALED